MSLAAVFQQLASAKPVTSSPRLEFGVHHVALINVRLAHSQHAGVVVTGNFLVDRSETVPVGAERVWSWFPQSQSWTGKYEIERCRSFFSSACAAVGVDFALLAAEGKLEDELHLLVGACLTVEVTEKTVPNRRGAMWGIAGPIYPDPTARMVRSAEWRPDLRQSPEVLARVAIAAEARALALDASGHGDRAGQWMDVFRLLAGNV